jgi:hypothetical protein
MRMYVASASMGGGKMKNNLVTFEGVCDFS